nr:hypothetical protein [Myxococcota bacterium]
PVTGGGSGSAAGSSAATCEGTRARVEGLYRRELADQEPGRMTQLVADNTTMVLDDCAKDPPRVIACIAAAASVADLERTCLLPLDDEGSEGDALRK